MNNSNHDWNLTPKQAIALQKELAQNIILEDQLNEINYIAGIDIAINNTTKTARAAVIVFSFPELILIEQHTHEQPLEMPYIPGLLSFREIPSMINAFRKLKQKPQLILVDGMGIAHPRGIGIASHLGLLLNIPTIGCAKSILVGQYDKNNLSSLAGSREPLTYKGKVIGCALRTRNNTNPIIISPGHLITLATSIELVLKCSKGYKLPEPIRLADKLSKFK